MSARENSSCRCPHCGTEIPPEAPGGWCPHCVLGEARSTSPDDVGSTTLVLSDIADLPEELPNIGAYQILGTIARGGMGVVYRARQKSLNRVVALKMLLGGVHASAQARERFKQEAAALAMLNDENIVRIHELGEHEGHLYFSMDYVEGTDLGKKAQNGPLAAREAAAFVQVAARAVQVAHRSGLIHRDLKPANILVNAQGQVRVSDFGLAKMLDSESGLTLSGQLLGTPGYMPPEQVSKDFGPLGPCCDVYSLGAVLYHLLTGRPPFVADSLESTVRRVLEDDPVPPHRLNAAVPSELETICLKCLEKEPARRYASAESLAVDLDRWLQGLHPLGSRPWWPVRLWGRAKRKPALATLGLALAVVAVASGLVMARQSHRASGQRLETGLRLALGRADKSLQAGDRRTALLELAGGWRGAPQRPALTEMLVNLLDHHSYLVPAARPATETVSSAPDPQLHFRVAASRDGLLLATATNQENPSPDRGMIRFWDKTSGQPRLVTVNSNHTRVIRSLAFSPEARHLVSASDDGTARVWRVEDGTMAQLFRHPDYVHHATFSPDGQLIVTAGNDGLVRLWRFDQPGATLRAISHGGAVNSARFSPDGQGIVSAGDDGWVRVWETATGQPAAEPLRLPGPVFDAEFLANARVLRVNLDDGNYRYLACTRTRLLESIRPESPEGISSAEPNQTAPSSLLTRLAPDEITTNAISPSGKLLALAVNDTVRVVDIRAGRDLVPTLPHASKVNRVCFSPDSRRLATSTIGRQVRLWDVGLGSPLTDWLPCPDPVFGLLFSQDGSGLIAIMGQTQAVWRICQSSQPAPAWLAELAEAVAGARLSQQRVSEPVPPEQFLALRQRILASQEDTPLALWARRWLDPSP
jgi:eukaryotic-like serine/threonine-protein kinase